jgi:hypothetical protein
LVAVLLLFGLTGGIDTARAATDPAQAEQQFTSLLNQTRAGHGMAALQSDPAAAIVAREWSTQMATEGRLYHNPELKEDVERVVTLNWSRLGENVGYGGSVPSLHDAFYNSAGHRANMLGDFNRVGVGVVVTDRVWVTFVFIKAAALVAQAPCSAAGYILDGYGGVHPVGGAPGLPSGGYWPGWHIARDISVTPDGTGGQKLDGFGGLFPLGAAPKIKPGGYWHGWDIARAVAVTGDAKGAYVLDAFGGIHAAGNAPARTSSGYWLGWAIARDIVVDPANGTRGYVLDGFGGLHPFGGMPAARLSKYFGRDVGVSVTMLADGTGGYTTARSGGTYAFAVGSNPMPPQIGRSVPLSGAAIGFISGASPVVVATNGSEQGAGGAACGSPPRWPIHVGVATADA